MRHPTLATAHEPVPLTRAALAAVVVMALFIAHHLYGAAIYTAAFRKHAAIVGVPVTLAIVIGALASRKLASERGREVWRRLTIILILVFPLVLVGLFEGLYNHVLKNLIHISGLYPALGPVLFPGGLYEPPSNAAFEVTGVLQFVLAVVAARELWRATRRPAA